MTRRFDSQEYLDDWKLAGRWPSIHDEIAGLVARTVGSVLNVHVVCDVCCSSGLLAARIQSLTGVTAIGVDVDRRALAAGRDAGVPVELFELALAPATLPTFGALLTEHRVNGLVMRRCLPELFGSSGVLDVPFLQAFSDTAVTAGVGRLWVQGRVPSSKATNALPRLEDEVAALAEVGWSGVRRTSNCAYLVRA